jgi:UDP-N-acetylmuramoyl-L-alanyl-D-glutamate--2,6-diaminopimelate ligase
MHLSTLIAGLPVSTLRGDARVDIRDITFDSREVSPASLFVALRGGYTDGHRFLAQARDAGAVAAVVEFGTPLSATSGYGAVVEVSDTRAALAQLAATFFGHPSMAMTVVGVTGTDGKTTTSHFIESICRSAGQRTGLIGTVAIRIGDTEELHESRQTTPESLLVQRYLAAMRDADVETAVVEATSHGLETHRLDGCLFDVGVVTNVTREHLDFHGTVEQYRIAKGGLFRRVVAAREQGKLGVSVVNLDDEGARAIERFAAGGTILRYSQSPDSAADILAEGITSSASGSSFVLRTPAGSAPVDISLPGRYNVANALAAAAAGHALGLSPQQIAAGLAALRAVPGRMETVERGQPFAVIVDYAHTPEAIRSVLAEARKVARGRVLALFGSAGERDVEKRALQGAVAVTDADYAVFTSEDPRFEDPETIIAEIAAGALEAGGRTGVDFDCIEDRREAMSAILRRAAPGDVVVLAGKGHERSMIYGAEKRPWDEAAVAGDLLATMGYRSPNDPGNRA